MKKLIIILGLIGLFVGCGELVEDAPNNETTPGGEQKLLPYPIGLDHKVVNKRGENVWQYFYDYNAIDKDDFKYLVNISMYCNPDEGFDFINNSIVFRVMSWEFDNTSGKAVDVEPIPSYTTPYFWSMYYCVFSRGSHPEYYTKLGYRYEMHFPLLFPAAGRYSLQFSLAQPTELFEPNGDMEYQYLTETITIRIYEDKYDDNLPMCGGKVTIAKGFNVAL